MTTTKPGWRAQCDVVKADIDYKHHRMKKSAFIFLRATYFRWAKKIGDWCPQLMDAPPVLSVGDLHLENFGTWRDADGRLVWGVNDFDEAAIMPYVLDLVRLAASIRLAPDLAVGNQAAAEALLKGYREGLDDPQPALLTKAKPGCGPMPNAPTSSRRNSGRKSPDIPRQVRRRGRRSADRHSAKGRGKKVRMCSRRKGGGSLGRPRYVAVAYWRGGQVLREAKALVPSAWVWAHGKKNQTSNFLELANGRYRAPDPFLHVRNKFIFRRIGADSQKIELGDDAGAMLRLDLLRAMGFDLASIHAAGSPATRAIQRDLRKRPGGWLNAAAKAAATAVERDFEEWRT